MPLQTATNPKTNEQVILVGGKWLPVSQTATNPDTGARAYLANGSWVVDETAPAAPDERTTLLGYVPETLKAIGAGGAGMLESALTGASFLLPEESEQAARAKVAEIGGGVQEFLAPDTSYEGTYLDLMRGVGSTLPFLATSFLGVPGLIASAAMGVSTGSGEAAQRAIAAGATEDEISKAAGYGMIPGALEMIAPARIVKRAREALGPLTPKIADALDNSFRTRLARISGGKLGRVGKAALEEAAQEASSEVLQNLITQGVYDPNTGTFEGVGESAALGGGVGGILALFTDIIIPGTRRGGGEPTVDRGIFEESTAEVPPAGPPPAGPLPAGPLPTNLLNRQDSTTVISAEDIERFGISLDKSTGDKLFGLDLATTEGRTQAQKILTAYRNNPAVQRIKPENVSRIDSFLRSEIFGARDYLAQEPEAEVITAQERAPATVQPDMFDIDETQQIQDLLDTDELAQMQQEEDAQLAEKEVLAQESALETVDARVVDTRRKETEDKRKQVLLPIVERGDITDVANLTRAFSAELGRQGFTDTVPTQAELETINRAAGVQEAAVTKQADDIAQDAQLETRQAEETAAGVAELESLIPERKQAAPVIEPTAKELQRTAQNLANQQVRDRTGRGTEGQLEIPVIERQERAASPLEGDETTVVEEVAPVVRKANKGFFDALGVSPNAPIRKRAMKEGMDTANPQLRAALVALGRNANAAAQTKVNINNFLQNTPEAAAQLDLFVPTSPRPTVLERTRDAEAKARADTRADKVAAQVATTKPDPVESELAQNTAAMREVVAALKAQTEANAVKPAAAVATNAPVNAGGELLARDVVVPEDAVEDAVAPKDKKPKGKKPETAKEAAKTPLEQLQTTRVTKNNKYKPAGAMKKYLDLAEQDMDVALRTIAFDAIKPRESTIKTVNARKESAAARQWVEENMPESTPALEAFTAQAKVEETQRTEADLRRSPTGTKADDVQKRRKEDAANAKIIKGYINPTNNTDSMTMEVINDIIGYQNDVVDDSDAIKAQGIDLQAYLQNYLKTDAIAATMATADASVAEKIDKGNILGALGAIYDSSVNPQVRKVAVALAKAVRGVKLTVVEDLTDSKGNQLAGIYDEATDTILINKSVTLSTHVVLHEAGHAATAKVLNNPSHPTTRALTTLYNDLKDKMPDEYGMESLKEFVAEAFTNPEFQAKLAAYKASGDKKTGWDRFWEAVGRLFGIDTTSASTETVDLINTLLATEPSTRMATTVPGDIAKGKNAEAVIHLLSRDKKFLQDAPLPTGEELLAWGSRVEQKVRANFLNGVGLEAITDFLKLRVPSAKKVEQILNKIDGMRVTYTKEYTNLLNDAKGALKGSSAAREIFNKLVSFSTINRMDPTVDEDKVKKHWLVYGEYDAKTKQYTRKEVKFDTKAKMDAEKTKLEARQEADKVAARPSPIMGEIQAIEPTRERIAQYEESVRLFKSLSPTQRGAYIALRDFYKNINSEIIAAQEDNVSKLETEEEVKKTIRDVMFLRQLKAGFIDPYFPLTRSGEYWLEFSYKDDNGQTTYGTGSFDSWLQRSRAMAKLRELPNVDKATVKVRSLAEIQKRTYNNQIPIPFLSDLKKKIKALDITDAKGKAQVDAFIADLILRALPDQSLIQSRMVRQNIAFFEGDALTSFQQRGPQFVNSLANLTYLVDLEIAGKEVRAERDALPEGEELAREAATIVAGTREETGEMQLFGKLPSYIEFSKNAYLSPLARWLRSGTFIWTLGWNISSVGVNTSILPLVLQSKLAAKYGGVKATMATSEAATLYASTLGSVSREGIVDVDEKGKPLSEAVLKRELGGFSVTNDFSNDPEKEKKFAPFNPLKVLLKERGFDTRTIAAETSDLDNPTAPWVNKVTYWSGFLFNHSERAIRQISTMSTYMLEMEQLTGKKFNKISDAEIKQFGAQASETAIDTALYVNSSALLTTAPRIAQTSVGSLIWQFKRVPGQFLYTHLSMIKTLFDDATGKARNEAEREEARVLRNMFFYLTASGAALVGVKGIPMYGTVIALMNLFLDDDDDDAGTIIAKMAGQDKYYGLISQMFGVDVTDRIALTNLMIRDRGNYLPNSQMEGLIEAWAGPTYGVTGRVAGGLLDLFSDDPANKDRAIEAILPTGFSNVGKAYRFATKGYETGRGDAIITGELPMGDVLKQALGFSPISTRAARDELSLNIRKESGRKERRNKIIDKIVYGIQNDRPELLEAGMEDAKAYNADHPGTRIELSTIQQSIGGRAVRSATARITGGAPVDRNVLMEIMQSNREFDDGY